MGSHEILAPRADQVKAPKPRLVLVDICHTCLERPLQKINLNFDDAKYMMFVLGICELSGGQGKQHRSDCWRNAVGRKPGTYRHEYLQGPHTVRRKIIRIAVRYRPGPEKAASEFRKKQKRG